MKANTIRKGVRTTAKSSNRINIPEAREALDKFKMETASEVGINLSKGYNGDITARQAGSVGGRTVRNAHNARLLKNVRFMRGNGVVSGRKTVVKYMVGAAVRGTRRTRGIKDQASDNSNA